ncbi:MAG: glycoside-pentoside-hexuronide (GPH):cation symporter [Lachnospira sp.]|nr:glycoside-pentoside-hexuronide (GPH):cation symporter [Lachnospira sp.]
MSDTKTTVAAAQTGASMSTLSMPDREITAAEAQTGVTVRPLSVPDTKTTAAAAQTDASMRPLSWFTRIAYGLGDMAQNIMNGALTILTFFYTDYAGVNTATVALAMLISRIFDGFSDVVMGIIVEKTHSKYGKARPWILWMSVPFCVSLVLIYLIPANSTEFFHFWYIFITYNLCTTVCFTGMNLPYGSLSNMMTRVSKERDMLSIVRMTLSPCGKIISVSLTLPLVTMLGDTQRSWIVVMTIWSAVGLVLLLICFAKCKETVVFKARQKEESEKGKVEFSIGKSLKVLLTNIYFWACMVLWMMQCVIQYGTSTILPYYCRYVFNNSSLYSVLFFVETVTMVVVSITVSPFLLKKMGKRNMCLLGIVFALVCHLIYMANPTSFGMVVMSCVTRGIGFAPMNSVVFGLLGDCVDYGQWKTHIRLDALTYSGGSVGTKLGQGAITAFIPFMMGIAGYVSSTSATTQPDSAIRMIINLYRGVPLFIWVVILAVLLFYKLDKKMPEIAKELKERDDRGEM